MKKSLRIIAFCVSVLIPSSVLAGSYNLHIQNLQVSGLLPSNSVKRIFQDSRGFIWFGTRNGLCRYDGYSLKIIRSTWNTPSRLTNNVVKCIAEDEDNLWIGTEEGLNIIDKQTYKSKPLPLDELKDVQINTLLVDKQKNIWIGTSSRGLYRFSQEGKLIARYYYDKNNPNSIVSDAVLHVYQDRQGRIWVSTWERGLCIFNQKTNGFFRFGPIGKRNNPFRVFQDREDHLWIFTWGDGIYTVDAANPYTSPVIPVKLEGYSGTESGKQIFYAIAQDNNIGDVWAVSLDGLYRLQWKSHGVCTARSTTDLFEDPANKIFHEVLVDKSGNLWLGSEGEGIYKLDFNRLNVKNFALPDIKKQLGSTPNVTKFCETSDGMLYTVINRAGIFVLNPQTGVSKPLGNPEIAEYNSITAITRVHSLKQIWISSQGQNRIYAMSDDSRNGTSGHFIYINENHDQIISNILEDSHDYIWLATGSNVYYKTPYDNFVPLNYKIKNASIIKEDGFGNIWIVCNEGVLRFSRKKGIVENVQMPHDGRPILNGNIIQSVCCLRNGNVYLGTKEGSLFFYSYKADSVSDISKDYGIVEDDILDIVEDDFGQLWLSTPRRIIRYNPVNHAASYFSTADGIVVNSFSKDACMKLACGKILFGGNRGLAEFTPQRNAGRAAAAQQIAITDIVILNKSVFDIMDDNHYDPEKKRITLLSSENNFGIEFSSLDYSSSQKIQYTYMLEGIDKSWIYVGNNSRLVNYANLPSGSYTFRVKACDENGVWSSSEASLDIVILPPLYQRWWAYLIYLTIIGAGTYFFLRSLANKIRLRNDLRISNIENQKTEELAQIKLRYFTNISHELLTPLTIITLLIESMHKRHPESGQQLGMMLNNITRLKRLIQQILAFKKSESGNLKLKVQEADIICYVKSICQSNFRPLVEEKQVSLIIDTDQECFMAYFDLDKVDKILYNLLSNAFKYTPNGGEICVKIRFVSRNEQTVMVLSVSDSGSGISEEDLPNIFKRFYISRSSDQGQSHGIGLSLTQDLVDIHKGHIRVNSILGEGAVFTFEIPVSRNAYADTEMEKEPSDMHQAEDAIIAVDSHREEPETVKAEREYTILVAEDNAEIRNLIVAHLSDTYKVLSVDNGVAALSQIREQEIDLLISDVMMPEMDGLTLCRMVKNDVAVSHISVLMLTAKNTTEDRVDCYNAGADAYISKPFEMGLLAARVKNLLGKKRLAGDTFKSNMEVNISDMGYGSMDEDFLKEAITIVENHLADISFDFEIFAADMGASKSTLYRKLKSLTGLSPGEFIRNIRLKHAAKQLVRNTGNISDIAYSVGFNDSKYFSRSFKAEFGVTPSEFRDKHES